MNILWCFCTCALFYMCCPELELRQQRGALCQSALVLTVRDRQEPLGSGGATLNALLVAAEHLSSRAGHTVSLWTHIHVCHAPLLKFFIARRLQSVHTFGNLFPPSSFFMPHWPITPPHFQPFWCQNVQLILEIPACTFFAYVFKVLVFSSVQLCAFSKLHTFN